MATDGRPMAAAGRATPPSKISPIPYARARAAQPEGLSRTLESVGEQIARLRGDGRLRGPGPVFVGIGASLAAACAATWVLRGRGIDARRTAAGDLPLPYPRSTNPLVGISQSGRSPETIAVLGSVARERRVAVTNMRPSPLADLAGAALWLGGHDDSYASTLGYTATVLGLGLLADAWDEGGPDPAWSDVPALVESVIGDTNARVEELAGLFDGAASVDVVANGPSLGTAEGGALLLREVSRLPAAAMSTRTYLHGAMESAGRTVHVILGGSGEVGVCRTLAAAGHQVIFVTPEVVEHSAHLHHLPVPALPVGPRAVVEAVLIQGLAGAIAGRAGIDADAFVFDNPETKVAVAGRAGSS